MRFLLLIAHDETFRADDALFPAIHAWIAETTRRGARLGGNPLRPASEAVTVRVRDGKAERRPGPCSEARDQVAAYELIDCADLEEAVEIASRHPMAEAATIEVRPVWEELAE